MGVNDYGKNDADTLGSPPLGGPGGWAESVALALSQSDTPVDDRIAAKVSKAGDTMTGKLTVTNNVELDWLWAKQGGDFGGRNITGVADPNNYSDAATKGYVDNVATAGGSAVPVGTIVAYGGSTAPAGWHLCDGTAHGSMELETILGSPNAPNLRDRFILGAGGGYTLDVLGGSESHTLTTTHLPAHDHPGSGTAMNVTAGSGGTALTVAASGAPNGWRTGITGGGQPVNHMPPFYALTYIVKKGAS